MNYKENYWDSLSLKNEFNKFIKKIHNLDLILWDELGFWDNNYRPFSLFHNDKIVSNACVYSLDMIVNGKLCKAAQISAVGTSPEYRGQGLSRELNEKAITWAKDNHDFFFLFADKEAFGFYKRLKFVNVTEHVPSCSINEKKSTKEIIKLDISNKEDLDKIYNLAAEREPVSDILGILNKKLFMFWVAYFLKDYLYYIPDLDLLISFKKENSLITVYDIVSKKVPSFDIIYPYIAEPSDRTVEFMFMTDKMKLDRVNYNESTSSGTHVSEDFPLLNSKFIFPITAQA